MFVMFTKPLETKEGSDMFYKHYLIRTPFYMFKYFFVTKHTPFAVFSLLTSIISSIPSCTIFIFRTKTNSLMKDNYGQHNSAKIFLLERPYRVYLLANEPCAYISNNTAAATAWRDNGWYKKNPKESSQSALTGQREIALLQARFN